MVYGRPQERLNEMRSPFVCGYMSKPLKPPTEIVDACFPAWEVPGVPVRDLGLTCVTHAEPQDHMRIPRPGEHQASLVAVVKVYDGTSGGQPGTYLALWQEVRHAGQRWKTQTLKVRAEEAARIAKDMLARKPSAPRKGEPPRAGGRAGTTMDSQLLGLPVGKDGYLLYVRSSGGVGGTFVRSRGVEIKAWEAGVVAGLLGKVAAA